MTYWLTLGVGTGVSGASLLVLRRKELLLMRLIKFSGVYGLFGSWTGLFHFSFSRSAILIATVGAFLSSSGDSGSSTAVATGVAGSGERDIGISIVSLDSIKLWLVSLWASVFESS